MLFSGLYAIMGTKVFWVGRRTFMAELVRDLRKDKRQEEQREKRRNRLRKALSLFLVFLAMAGGAVFWWNTSARTYHGYSVTSELSLNGSLLTSLNEENRLILCYHDGASALDGTGKLLWEAAFQMDNPVAAACGRMTAIADIGGTQVCVVGENGIPHSYQVVYPIVRHAVAGQGVTAVLLDAGADDYIRLYDMMGELRVDINTKTKKDGFPVDIALSDDGTKLVTLYLSFDGDEMVSKVTFYNAGEVGKSYAGNVVGQKLYEGELIGGIDFLDNDTVCIRKESGADIYRMTQIPSFGTEIRADGVLLDLAVSSGGIALLQEKEKTGEKTLVYYTIQGKKQAEYSDIPEYESLFVGDGEVALFSPQQLTVYRGNASVKFSGELKQTYQRFAFGGGSRYFLIEPGRVQTIKLEKEQK